MEEEQVYTIPLRDAQKAERQKRAATAIRLVKDFVKKHTKVDEVKIGSNLNKKIWNKGAEKPPAKVRVRINKTTAGVAEVSSLE